MTWEERLSASERRDWDSFVRSVREGTLRGMTDSAVVMSLVPRGEPDIKYAVELGLSIMLGKPLIIVVSPGQDVPRKLTQVADVVIRADVDTAAGQKAIARELKSAMARLEGP